MNQFKLFRNNPGLVDRNEYLRTVKKIYRFFAIHDKSFYSENYGTLNAPTFLCRNERACDLDYELTARIIRVYLEISNVKFIKDLFNPYEF